MLNHRMSDWWWLKIIIFKKSWIFLKILLSLSHCASVCSNITNLLDLNQPKTVWWENTRLKKDVIVLEVSCYPRFLSHHSTLINLHPAELTGEKIWLLELPGTQINQYSHWNTSHTILKSFFHFKKSTSSHCLACHSDYSARALLFSFCFFLHHTATTN